MRYPQDGHTGEYDTQKKKKRSEEKQNKEKDATGNRRQNNTTTRKRTLNSPCDKKSARLTLESAVAESEIGGGETRLERYCDQYTSV